VVYEPDEEDTQGDYATADDIEDACHKFLEEYNQMSIEHERLTSAVRVCENYVTSQPLRVLYPISATI